MNILDIIRQEHREAAEMLDQAASMEPDDAGLSELADKLELALMMHLEIEEKLFYSRLRDRADESEEKVDVFEGFTEHEVAKHLIALLRSRRKRDELFKAEIQVLGESVKHHVQEEESTIFSLAHELMDETELEDLGTKWERAKQRAMAAPSKGPGRKKASTKAPAGRKKAAASKKTAKKTASKAARGKKTAKRR